MHKKDTGFTLIELMIVVAIIAIIASIAIPNLSSSRLNANESAAISTLKRIVAAQQQCQSSGIIDANNNGKGEYGFFAELAGRLPFRGGGTNRIEPPFLSPAFAEIDSIARGVRRSGYYFQLMLPADPTGVHIEAPTGGAGGPINAPNAEAYWGCMAWPASYGNSGRRAFFVNQSGEILATSNKAQRYDGTKKVPANDSAFMNGSHGNLASSLALNATGNDGQFWRVVN